MSTLGRSALGLLRSRSQDQMSTISPEEGEVRRRRAKLRCGFLGALVGLTADAAGPKPGVAGLLLNADVSG